MKVACGWLVGPNPLPTTWLVGGLEVALVWLRGLCPALPRWMMDVRCRLLGVPEKSSKCHPLGDTCTCMKNSLGGLSGSPAYRLNGRGELQLIGFAKLGAENAEAPNRKYQALPDSP